MYRTYTIIINRASDEVTTIWHLMNEDGCSLYANSIDEYDFELECESMFGVQVCCLPLKDIQQVIL